MPMHNLFGWMLNGLIFMSLSRLLWRTNFDAQHLAIWLPFGVYIANTGFAMVLNLGVGLWFPLFLTALLVLLPESLVLFPREESHTSSQPGPGRIALSQSIWLLMRAGSRIIGRCRLDLPPETPEYLSPPLPLPFPPPPFPYFSHFITLVRHIH